MYKLNILDKISFILVIIGAINWALIGLLNLDIVSLIFGAPINVIGRIIYIIIGVAGVELVLLLVKMRKYKI